MSTREKQGDESAKGYNPYESDSPESNGTPPLPSQPTQARRGPRFPVARQVALIILVFLLGCGTAVGHHFYYQSLSLKPVATTAVMFGNVRDQKWANHVGAAFAFATKFFFAFAVGGAYIQRLWAAARRAQGLSIDGLDAGFVLLRNPAKFLSGDLISSARMLVGLAAISWAVPLVAIFTPGSLIVQSQNLTRLIAPCSVPSIDLSAASSATVLGSYSQGFEAPHAPQSTPSPSMQRLALEALSSGTYTPPASPCGPVCAYETSFYGPYLDCSPPQPFDPAAIDVGGTTDVWSGDWERTPPQDTFDVNYCPDTVCATAYAVNCNAVNASYTLRITHDGAAHTVALRTLSILNPISTNASLLAYAGSSPADPANTPALRALVNAANVQGALLGLLEGVLVLGPTGPSLANTMVASSSIAQLVGNAWQAVDDVGAALQSLLLNITIGVMAFDIPGPSALSTETAAAPATTCTQVVTENVYLYRPLSLAVPYAAAFLATLVAVIVGLHALWRNGARGDSGFTMMLAATRNPDLDALVLDSGDKGRNERLRYGPVTIGIEQRVVFSRVPAVDSRV